MIIVNYHSWQSEVNKWYLIDLAYSMLSLICISFIISDVDILFVN